MKVFRLLIGMLLLTVLGCTKEAETRSVLASQGYTDIQITGYAIFGCSDDDLFHTKFTAISEANKTSVSGVACSGVLKGTTIRFK